MRISRREQNEIADEVLKEAQVEGFPEKSKKILEKIGIKNPKILTTSREYDVMLGMTSTLQCSDLKLLMGDSNFDYVSRSGKEFILVYKR